MSSDVVGQAGSSDTLCWTQSSDFVFHRKLGISRPLE